MPAYRTVTWTSFAGTGRPARDTIGLLALPNGAAMYAGRIMAYTTLPLEPDEVHRIGLDELAGIEEERGSSPIALASPTPPPPWPTARSAARTRRRPERRWCAIVEAQVERSWDAAPAYFGRLPKANCVVKQVEEFREQDVPMAFYQQPTADGSRPGVYYINTGDLDQRPLHLLAGVTYHEANPGHHFQVSLEQEFDERPALRRFGGILAGSAFAEGWGLYSERLADEMGLYRDDYERLGMLDAQAWRANRLDRGLGDPRAGVDPRAGRGPDDGGRLAARGGRDRGRSLHCVARAGPRLQDRADPDPDLAGGGRRRAGLLAARDSTTGCWPWGRCRWEPYDGRSRAPRRTRAPRATDPRIVPRASEAQAVASASPCATTAVAIGSENEKVHPCPGSVASVSWPPIASVRRRAMYRPSPTPPARLVMPDSAR